MSTLEEHLKEMGFSKTAPPPPPPVPPKMAGELKTEIVKAKMALLEATSEHRASQSKPSSTQVGGSHYASMKIQPFAYIHANGIGFAEGCVIKYVSRWKAKGGIEDLKKARHFLDLLIEQEEKGNQ